MPNQPKWPHVTFRADPELREKAMRKARLQGTTLSEVLRIRLEQYVYEDEWPFGEPLLDEAIGEDEPDEDEN